MKQTSLFGPDDPLHRQRTQRWFELGEQTQQELVALLVQMVVASHNSIDTREQDDDEPDK